MPSRHCADEQLLAWLDGELGWIAQGRVKRHLARCWSCRTRLAGMEEEVYDLIRRADRSPMPPEQIRAARNRFFERADVQEVTFASEEPPRFGAARRRLTPVKATDRTGAAWSRPA